jgi:hypothetical protein
MGCSLLFHGVFFLAAREFESERPTDPNASSRDYVWWSPTGYSRRATEREVHEHKYGRGSWAPHDPARNGQQDR